MASESAFFKASALVGSTIISDGATGQGYQASGSTLIQQSFTIPPSTTNTAISIGFAAANLQGLLITVTGNNSGTVVLLTNSTGSPAETKTYPTAGGKTSWDKSSTETNPFSNTVVNTCYWSNNDTSNTATVQVVLITNP